jgi:hypothetical protein
MSSSPAPGKRFSAGNTAKLLYDEPYVMIVKIDTAFHRLLNGVPVGLFKALLRTRGDLKKSTVLRIEPLQDGVGN